MKTEKISTLLGAGIALSSCILTYYYYEYRDTLIALRKPNSFFEAMESIDLRHNDLKYKFRGSRKSDAPVALIAIDDDSLREIGRWPWGRDLVGQMTQKIIDLGAKSVGFDVIFSEPEKGNPEADKSFGKVVEANADKIVLGVFSERELKTEPFRDYCIAEAFLHTKGDQIIKLNSTFSVDDPNENSFDQIGWAPLFQNYFKATESDTEGRILSELGKTDIAALTSFQVNYLNASKANDVFNFCETTWQPGENSFNIKSNGIAKDVILENEFFANQKEFTKFTTKEIIGKLYTETKTNPLRQYGQWTPNIPDIQNPALYTASFNAQLDEDGYVRRYPLFYRSGRKLGSSFLPSLAIQSYLISKGYRAELLLENSKFNKKAKAITKFSVIDTKSNPEKVIYDMPIDKMGQVLVNYYGRQMSLPYISAKEFFNDKPTMTVRYNVPDKATTGLHIEEFTVKKSDFMKDRSVIVGATAVGIYDLRNIPLEPNYPGPEIHLTMLANLFDQDFLKVWSQESTLMPLLALLIGILVSLAWSHMGPVKSILSAICLLAGAGLFDAWLFMKLNYVTSSVFLLIEIMGIYGGITIFKYFTEEKMKRQMKSTFARYVSPAIVEELIKDPENLKLGGRRQHMSVFFSDVRGFTTISEKLAPEDLSKLLNRYLSPMTQIVFHNNGTLDKYMGDAIMALFGAPIHFKDHAKLACRCALESIVKLKELQKELEAEGLPQIDIGIGINTGDMSVGNMGSNIVQNYTVMGDSVNLASRLEGINKEYGTRIIISQFTYDEVKDTFTAREVDRVKVKGKNEPVRIFELIQEGQVSGEAKERLDLFDKAYQKYLAKEFKEAKSMFLGVSSMNLEDKPAKLYIKRCEDFLEEPPPEAWDGVYVLKTK